MLTHDVHTIVNPSESGITSVQTILRQRQLRVLVAGGHRLFRNALCFLLQRDPDLSVVTVDHCNESVRVAARHRPHVTVLDVEVPDNDPRGAVRKLLDADPTTRMIALGRNDDQVFIDDLLAMGVHRYAHKNVSQSELVATIRTVVEDLPPHGTARRGPAEPAPTKTLSTRETQILTLVGLALSNRQISARLGITEGTVKQHMRNIFTKLGAVSRIDAVLKAGAL
jgi:two-component system, NarL family, nitrate/nitrite response regulator NarL